MRPDLTGAAGSTRLPRVVAAVYVVVYGALQLAAAISTAFHPAVNDALGIMAIARGIDWSDLGTLHNGFFPIGLPVVLALLPQGSWFALASLGSLAFALAALAATWIIAARLASAWWALLAVVAVSVDPTFAAYAASPGPDVIALGLATVGIAVYVTEATGRAPTVRWWVLACSGALLGFAGVFRYHAALVGVGLVAWCLLQQRQRLAAVSAAVAGIAVGYSPQVVANLLGGYGPLANDGGFTMYQSVVDINWLATGSIDRAAYASPLRVILDHPVPFAAAYADSATAYVVPVALAAIAVLVRRRRNAGTVLVSLLVAVVAYALVVSTGNSPRGVLAVVPITAVAIAVIADRAFALSRDVAPGWQRAVALIALAGAVVVVPQARTVLADLTTRQAQERERAAVDAAVVRYGGATSAQQVLTNDFNLYFTDLPGIGPDTLGGWTDISLNGDAPHRDVDLSSVRAFVCGASARGVRLVLWLPANAVPDMDEQLSGALTGATTVTGLRSVGTIGPYQATLVEPGYVCP